MDQDFNQSKLIKSKGPWLFTTQRIYRRPDGSRLVWESRHHRKGLGTVEPGRSVTVGTILLRCLWMPRQLNWWIGIVFARVLLLFMLGSLLSLAPGLATKWSLDTTGINGIFFFGSIPFTTSAYLQLFQAANAGEFSPQLNQPMSRRVLWFGWFPRNIGWLSCGLQFVGTLLFNINTVARNRQ